MGHLRAEEEVCCPGKFFIPEYKIKRLLFAIYNLFDRVWDISGLRKKSVAPGPGGLDDHLKNPGTTDLFGQVGATRADRKINVLTFEPGV